MAFEMTQGALLGLCRERGMYAHRPELNEVLHVTDRGVLRIAGLEAFAGLRALYLEGNALEDIEGLEGCPELRCLYLARNVIEEVGPGLATLTHLTTLDLSSNMLEGAALGGLAGLLELRTLNVAHNRLACRADLEPLAALPSLEVLDVSNNRIDDPKACTLLQGLPLKWLRFLGNPVVRATAGYRKVFLAAMHATLESLDDHPAFEADKRCALAWSEGGVEAERTERQKIRDEEAARRVRQQERFQAMVEEARRKTPEPKDPMRFRAVPVGESDDEFSDLNEGVNELEDRQGPSSPGSGDEEDGEEPPPSLERMADKEAACEDSVPDVATLVLDDESAEYRIPVKDVPRGDECSRESAALSKVGSTEGNDNEAIPAGSGTCQVLGHSKAPSETARGPSESASSVRSRGLSSDLQAALRRKEGQFRSGMRLRELEKAAASTERVMALRQSRLDEQTEKLQGERMKSSRTPVIWGTGNFKHLWEAAKSIGERDEEEKRRSGGVGTAGEGAVPDATQARSGEVTGAGSSSEDGDESGYSSEESVDLYERHSVTGMGQRHDVV